VFDIRSKKTRRPEASSLRVVAPDAAYADRVSFTVSGASIVGLLRYARARGVRTDGVLAEVGLDLTDDALGAPDMRVAQAANERVWELVAARSGDDHFGLHFAEALDIDALHVLGHLAAQCQTFGESLERFVRFSRLLHDAGRVELETADDEATIFPGCRGLASAPPRHVAEFSAALVIVLARKLTNAEVTARRVTFRHGRPRAVSEHVRIFGVAPTFGDAESIIALDREVLARRVAHANPILASHLELYARGLVDRLPKGEASWADRVRRVMSTSLSSGDVSAAVIAKRLALHPRTLQRRLEEEGIRFQDLVDETRRDLAIHHLREGKLAISEIAFLLGYSEPSVFHRAFRRWTGRTPASFRD
jgi:AraC-like DNA-binding protein